MAGDTRIIKAPFGVGLRKNTHANPPPKNEKYLILDDDGTLKEFREDGSKVALGGGGVSTNWLEFFRARGFAKLTGLTAVQVAVFEDDFFNGISGEMGAWATAGTVTNVLDDQGGTIRINTTTVSFAYRNDANTPPIAKIDQPFYYAGRFKIATGVAAAGSAYGVVLWNGNVTQHGFFIGANGTGTTGGSNTKYSLLQLNGGGLNVVLSTVTIDNGWHYGEVWFDGTKYWFAVDDETPIDISAGRLPAAGQFLWPATYGADAAASRDWRTDAIVVMARRA